MICETIFGKNRKENLRKKREWCYSDSVFFFFLSSRISLSIGSFVISFGSNSASALTKRKPDYSNIHHSRRDSLRYETVVGLFLLAHESGLTPTLDARAHLFSQGYCVTTIAHLLEHFYNLYSTRTL